MKTVLILVLSLIFIIFLLSFICFILVFYNRKTKQMPSCYPVPSGKIYKPYIDEMTMWVKEVRELPHKDVEIISEDSLKLKGRYYEFYDGAPIELMIHGYRGSSERDLSGGVLRARSIGHNVLIVDNRASGNSDGHIITFGIKEHKDCLKWIDFIINKIDNNAQIILTGISMGASTVLMAGSCDLPKNVIGILADCGFTSAEKIIKDVLCKFHLHPILLYPFISMGARVFGGINLNEYSALEAVKKISLPTIFFHGDTDAFVPLYMSKENFENCSSEKKRLVITKGAGHGLCYIIDKESYLNELKEFFK